VAITRTDIGLTLQDGRELWVPAGFHTDGATILRLLRVFYERFDPRYLRSAVVHDFLYSAHDFADWMKIPSRAVVDSIFYGAMKAEGFSRAWLFYGAVRAFGAPIWHWTPNAPGVEQYFHRLADAGYTFGERPGCLSALTYVPPATCHASHTRRSDASDAHSGGSLIYPLQVGGALGHASKARPVFPPASCEAGAVGSHGAAMTTQRIDAPETRPVAAPGDTL